MTRQKLIGLTVNDISRETNTRLDLPLQSDYPSQIEVSFAVQAVEIAVSLI